jgi:hypothetical protein
MTLKVASMIPLVRDCRFRVAGAANRSPGALALSPDCERLRGEPKTLALDETRGPAGQIRGMPECA